MNAAPLACSGLTVERGGQRVLHAVSLQLGAGRWVAVVGRNGAGKSSLLAALAGLLPPSAGAVRLNGRPLAEWPTRERARHIAWMGQAGAVDGELPAIEVVRLARLPHQGLFAAWTAADEAAVAAAMRCTDCAALAQRPLSMLSGGERQRVLLARVLAVQAPVLLLDEPLAHLDPAHQVALVETVRELCRAGASVITVLHDLTTALAADEVWLLDDGHLVASGAPAEATLRQALVRSFGAAFTIEALPHDGRGGRLRWVVVPTLPA